MLGKFPKPWRLEHVGFDQWVVTDANECKLFYITGDENPDGEDAPGRLDGPTIVGYGEDADHEAILTEVQNLFLPNA